MFTYIERHTVEAPAVVFYFYRASAYIHREWKQWLVKSLVKWFQIKNKIISCKLIGKTSDQKHFKIKIENRDFDFINHTILIITHHWMKVQHARIDITFPPICQSVRGNGGNGIA